MITLIKVKEFVGDPTMSDEEAEEVRDACYGMAEVFLEAWAPGATCPRFAQSIEKEGKPGADLTAPPESVVR